MMERTRRTSPVRQAAGGFAFPVAAFLVALLFSPVIGHNVVTDPGFEEDNSVWAEIALPDTGERHPVADRHVPGGYQSGYCGLTDTWYYVLNTEWAQLKQGLTSARAVTDIDSVRWSYRFTPRPTWIYWFGIAFASKHDTLYYVYDTPRYPPTEHMKIISLGLGGTDTWVTESRFLGGEWGDWVAQGLPPDAVIDTLWILSEGSQTPQGWLSQIVKWDDILVSSPFLCRDATVLQASMDTVGVAMVPSGRVRNSGYDSMACGVHCRIVLGGVDVYVDTQAVTLARDSATAVTFAPFVPHDIGTYEVTVFSALAGDEDPANDTAWTSFYVATGIAEGREHASPIFRLWPSVARSAIRYEFSSRVHIYDATGAFRGEILPGKGVLEPRKLGYHGGVYFCQDAAGRCAKLVVVE